MVIGNIDRLIQEWKKDKKRTSRRATFAQNLKGYRQFVATVASQYLSRIRDFITMDYSDRRTVLKTWKLLVDELEEDMRMLDAFDPSGNTQFFASIVIARNTLDDKKARKAFEQSKIEPVDAFGNPEFISSMTASLDTILDQTYHALRGMTSKDLHRSLVRRASQRLHTALTQGVVRDLGEFQTLLLPSLTVVEMEIEKFHIEKLDSKIGTE